MCNLLIKTNEALNCCEHEINVINNTIEYVNECKRVIFIEFIRLEQFPGFGGRCLVDGER